MKKSLFALVPIGICIACSDNTTSNPADAGSDVKTDAPSNDDGGPAGGPVSGAVDTHCTGDAGPITQSVSNSSCHPDAGPPDDAGADDGGAPAYGDTLFNAEGDDDDCKYHLKWTATPIRQGTDVTFTVTVTTKDGTPAPVRPLAEEGSGGYYPIRLEVFLNDTHPAPNTKQTSTETSTPGTYTAGPVRFDASGKWTVRFHIHEVCEDTLPDSPHGHGAFYVQVP